MPKTLKYSISLFFSLMMLHACDLSAQVQLSDIFAQPSAREKIATLKKWQANCPEHHDPEYAPELDVIHYAIAVDYINEGSSKKAISYLHQMNDEFWGGRAYWGIAKVFHKVGDDKRSDQYYQLALSSARKNYSTDVSRDSSGLASFTLLGILRDYGKQLLQQKRYAEAFVLATETLKDDRQLSAKTVKEYAQHLEVLHKQ